MCGGSRSRAEGQLSWNTTKKPLCLTVKISACVHMVPKKNRVFISLLALFMSAMMCVSSAGSPLASMHSPCMDSQVSFNHEIHSSRGSSDFSDGSAHAINDPSGDRAQAPKDAPQQGPHHAQQHAPHHAPQHGDRGYSTSACDCCDSSICAMTQCGAAPVAALDSYLPLSVVADGLFIADRLPHYKPANRSTLYRPPISR